MILNLILITLNFVLACAITVIIYLSIIILNAISNSKFNITLALIVMYSDRLRSSNSTILKS